MAKLAGDPSTPRFYGWYVVAAVFFVSAVAIGTRQAFGLFVGPWTEEFGVSVVVISAVWVGRERAGAAGRRQAD